MRRSGLVSRFLLFTLLLCIGTSLAEEKPVKRKQSEKFAGSLREPPDRVADALHLRLEVSFDWETSKVTGKVTHRFRSFRDDLKSIELDAVDIEVSRVTDEARRELEFESLSKKCVVHLAEPVKKGEEFGFTISYECQPRRGVYFRKPSPEAPQVPRQIWTQGETHEARHWIPCFDYPSDRLTTELLITAPDGMQAISNGRLLEVRTLRDGQKRFHWLQDKPHVTYLIAVVIGTFAEYRDRWRDVELVSYVPPDRETDAARSFKLTADMMEFFSEITGFPYPWGKYDQLCVYEFLIGGMENTGTTILTDYTLHDEKGALDYTSRDLVAHELAHQWFGDLVTCRDWADLWLNESFATFFETLYINRHRGPDEAFWDRKLQGDHYFAEDSGRYRRPLSVRTYTHPDAVFDNHAYPKGARILAMLMYVLGEADFFKGVQLYLKRHAFQSVETADFRMAMEDATGKSLQWFFDQWIHSGGHPEYRVKKSWDPEAKMVKVEVEQVQVLDEVTKLFRLPVEIEVTTSEGAKIHRVEVSGKKESFSFPAAERPLMVRFDKQGWILKQLSFEKPLGELIYQLENDDAPVGRIQAAKDLGELSTYPRAGEALLERLGKDPFWGVRVEIAKALKNFETDGTRDGLVLAYDSEKKSTVRREIVVSLAELKGEKLAAFFRRVIKEDPSYYTVGQALRGLRAVDEAKSFPDLFAALNRESMSGSIRAAAMDSIAELSKEEQIGESEKERAIEKLTELASPRHLRVVRTAALRALSQVGKGSESVYDTIAEAIDDPFQRVRVAVFDALGRLEDERGIELLQKRRKIEGHRPFRDPVETIDRAIAKIRKSDSVDSRVEKLSKSQTELRKRLEKLENAEKR